MERILGTRKKEKFRRNVGRLLLSFCLWVDYDLEWVGVCVCVCAVVVVLYRC